METDKQTLELTDVKASLFEMLNTYWGKGDGEKPPEFIIKAARLCGFALNDVPPALTPEPFPERYMPVFLTGEEWFALLARSAGNALSPAGVTLYNRAGRKIKARLGSESGRVEAAPKMVEENIL